MKSILFVLFFLFAVAFCYDLTSFEATYGKNYLPAERAFRAKVLEYNMEWIKKVNAEDHPYIVGVTPFADMTNTEFANSKLCGCMLRPIKTRKVNMTYQGETFEDEIDWRERGAVTPVKNQMSCGSCWAFSATGALEGGNYIANGKLVSLSEQQLVDCDEQSEGCNGGLMTNAFDYVVKRGLCTEEAYPYHAKDENCKENQCEPVIRTTGYEDVPENDGAALKFAVMRMPVSVTVEADSAVFQMYKSGILDDTACGISLNHGVLAVGYAEDYWIVKNSWGEDWGDKGYLRIKYTEKGEGICGINMDASYPTF